MRTETPKTILLQDYQKPLYRVERVDLCFRIFDGKTIVVAQTVFVKDHAGQEPIRLNGEHLKLLSVKVNGQDAGNVTLDDKSLTIPYAGERVVTDIEVEITPETNTRLEGLYMSGGNYCTQCEAEGFRTITYFPDRPDVLTIFTTRIEADRTRCPVLLSNGNLMEEGEMEGGRHYAVWHDPFPKPCYLFAVVAGDLVDLRDEFITKSGRKVDLRIYVREGDLDQCGFAMQSLKNSMKWDEDVYGREYELDRFNIVAVSDFNMGAMENTSLNIFNTALVLAHPETATDTDFERVESVIAHEYFHNWTGNRVTCRDWFQLSLKEGLTVFRDQEFSADLNSRAVKRIDDVQMLRRMQFAEDAGPLAHPIRPDNYIEINNFYTVTVYEKGAEVIRMQHTLLGADDYRKATDLYFERFDGQAVTCEDFVQCMEDVSGQNLTGQFFNWYRQAGTPHVHMTSEYDEENRRFTLHFTQKIPPTPGQPDKAPMLIPVAVGLVGSNGDDMDLGGGETTRILRLERERQSFTFENITTRPVPSVLRNFSAPVKLSSDLSDADLRFLMVHDSDGFNRWEAGQIFALRAINAMLDHAEAGRDFTVPDALVEAYGFLLEQAMRADADRALLARALVLPDMSVIGQQRALAYPHAIHAVREAVMRGVAERYGDALRAIYDANDMAGAFDSSPDARAGRALKNTVLRLLARRDDGAVMLASTQYHNATNMTDRVASLSVLADSTSPERDRAFLDFYARFKNYPLVIDKWFSLQATAVRDGTIDDVTKLRAHQDFNINNPNRVRSLYAAFAMNNPVSFHRPDGAGYRFLCDAIMELNKINPQIASRILTPMRDWKRYEPSLSAKMRAELERLSNLPDLSPDLFEVVNKSLAG